MNTGLEKLLCRQFCLEDDLIPEYLIYLIITLTYYYIQMIYIKFLSQ